MLPQSVSDLNTKDYKVLDFKRLQVAEKLKELGMSHYRQSISNLHGPKSFDKIKTENMFYWKIKEDGKKYILMTNPVVSRSTLYISLYKVNHNQSFDSLDIRKFFFMNTNSNLHKIINDFDITAEDAHRVILREMIKIFPSGKLNDFKKKIEFYL